MRTALGAVGAAIIGVTCFLIYIGYLGGAVFTDVPARAPNASSLAAVVLSSDMGFRVGMGPKIADRLAASGIPVTGVNSLAYFRFRRTPQQTTEMLAQAITRSLRKPGASRVALIGQSFGADALHVGLAGLPPALRKRIAFVALIVPGKTIFYRASPSGVFNRSEGDAEALPTAKQLSWVPALCIQGMEETDSLCQDLKLANFQVIRLPGGHLLHRDANAVVAALIHALHRVQPGLRASHAAP